MNEVLKTWVPENPLNLNETLLAMRAYAPFHHLYAVEMCFSISNNQAEKVASPSKSYEAATKAGLVDEIVEVAGIGIAISCFHIAFTFAPSRRCWREKASRDRADRRRFRPAQIAPHTTTVDFFK